MTLGKRIALCRKKSGMSQEDLADRLSLSRQAVSRWETDAALPDVEKIIQLSRIFNVTTDYLLLGETSDFSLQESASLSAEEYALRERKRHFRIGFGISSLATGALTAVAALILAQFHANRLTEWWTRWGRYGTALFFSWRFHLLLLGILLAVIGAGVLLREYFRKD
jgi:transcriptional regulator with XRE-family HTH domain